MRNRRIPCHLENLEFRRLLAAVDIPDNLSGNVSAIVSAPVNIDTASGVRGAEIRLVYDTNILNLNNGAVAAGSVWAGNDDTQITANVNDATGTVVVFISSSAPLADASGSLVVLNFSISGSATVSASAAIDLTSVILNEGVVTVLPAPIPGLDSTDGRILVSGEPMEPGDGTGRLAGFVFADANLDGMLSPGEAIPGVVITLVNSATGQQQQTTTAADGSYEFPNLASGSYQLQEQQPVAYIDGGVNSIQVQLVEGVSVGDQNFIERGLLPQFLYTRLLTTSVQPVGSAVWRAQMVQINMDAESGTIAAPQLGTFIASAMTAISNSIPIAASTEHSSVDSILPQAEGESEADALMSIAPATAGYEAVWLPDDNEKENVEQENAARLLALDQAILALNSD